MTRLVLVPPPAAAPTFTSVYQAQFDYVWNTLRRLGVASRHLEDVAHDVFLVVHRQLPSFDPMRPLRPWLFGIAFNVASDHRRRASVEREIPTPEVEPEPGGAGPEEALDARQRRTLVLAALGDLDDGHRAVLVLCDVDGAPGPEAAEVLKIPLNTVYSRLRTARQRFAAAVMRRQRGNTP
jgi:RNA polymerase sigma-70 factor (ECF subfamily)